MDCGDAYYPFYENYERNVGLSKVLIKHNTGKLITISQTFDSDIEAEIAANFEEDESSNKMIELSLFYFWLRLKQPGVDKVKIEPCQFQQGSIFFCLDHHH